MGRFTYLADLLRRNAILISVLLACSAAFAADMHLPSTEATDVTVDNVTASKVLVSDANKKIISSSLASANLDYFDISSSLTTLLAAKAPLASPTFTGTITVPLTASTVPYVDASSQLVSSAVTPTELNRLLTVGSDLCGITDTCIETNKQFTAPIIDILNLTDQASTPASPSSGTHKLYFKTDGTAYSLDSTGTETPIGSGGAGGTNAQREYISNGTAETNTTGWATYADAAASTPADGTGGSPNITLARTTTSGEILRGNASFKITKDAANRQGEGWSYDFTIDPQDYANGQPVILSFDYKTGSNYASGDVYVYVYDVDAGSLITVQDFSNASGEVFASTSGTRWSGLFYPTNSTSANYRLIYHIASTNALAWGFTHDSVHAGSNDSVPGAIVTDPVAYTPTFTGFGTVTNVNFISWRDGSFLKVKGTFTTGTPTATEARVSLGFNGTDGNVMSVSTLPTVQRVGALSGGGSSTTFFSLSSVLAEASKSYVTFGVQASTQDGLSKALGNAMTGSSKTLSFYAEVPISGWAASAAISTSDVLYQTQSWTGYHDSTCSWSRTNTSYGAPTADSTCSLAERTNKNMGTVSTETSGGNAEPGIVFVPRAATKYEICAGFTWWGPATATVSVGVQMVNGATILTGQGFQTTGTNQPLLPARLCGDLDVTGSMVGQSQTVSLQTKSASGAITLSGIDSAIEWSIKEKPDFSVFATYQDMKRAIATIDGGDVSTVCSSSPCTLERVYPSGWLTSVTRSGAGRYSATIATGFFSEIPNCKMQLVSGGSGRLFPFFGSAPTATSLAQDFDSTSGVATDAAWFIQCEGK